MRDDCSESVDLADDTKAPDLVEWCNVDDEWAPWLPGIGDDWPGGGVGDGDGPGEWDTWAMVDGFSLL